MYKNDLSIGGAVSAHTNFNDTSTATTGFTSPAQDHIESDLNVHRYLVENPIASFFLTVDTDAMKGIGIIAGHKIVVDCSKPPLHQSIIVCILDNQHILRRLIKEVDGTMRLRAENLAYPDIVLHPGQCLEIWGVVTSCFRKFP